MVIAVSLVVSWIVAVLFTPLLGVAILPAKIKGHHEKKGRVGRLFAVPASGLHASPLDHHRGDDRGLRVAVFGMEFVQQQFFPSSDRAELVIDWNLPQNASIAETNAQMARFEREQLQGNDESTIGRPMLEPVLHVLCCRSMCKRPTTWFGQMVVVTKGGIDARDRLKANSRPI